MVDICGFPMRFAPTFEPICRVLTPHAPPRRVRSPSCDWASQPGSVGCTPPLPNLIALIAMEIPWLVNLESTNMLFFPCSYGTQLARAI